MTSVISDVELKSQLDRTIMDNNMFHGRAARRKLRSGTYKNLFVLCMAFLLQFTAFGAMGNLQSSLNTEANVGVNSLSIIYACLIFSSIFLPHPLIAIFGLKWTIVICQVPYVLLTRVFDADVLLSAIFYMSRRITTRRHI
jgi:hypothetical protein